MNELKSILIELYKENLTASVIITILLLAIFAFIIWHIASLYTDRKNRPCSSHEEKIGKISSSVEKINTLPCTRHENFLNKHQEKISAIEAMNAKLDGILSTLQSMGGGNNPLLQAHSPISLTPYGKDLVTELNLEKYIDENWAKISKYIEENSSSMNPYDIQQLCFNYTVVKPDDVLSIEGYDRVKSKAYLMGIPSVNLLQATSILIRDRYFKEHSIDVMDIDRHDPSKIEEG
ncbi:hypothetical protein LJC52_04490 [Bacteroidales bacterium OttesenSCG-928-A17]|nr:hypothetical protein [Bacteroidales bacterium OttesenSCG-928-A17]